MTLQNPPKGYRWVRMGEVMRSTDQFKYRGRWYNTVFAGHAAIGRDCERYRRRIRTTKKGRKKK